MPLNAFIGMLVATLFVGGIIWLVVRVVRKGREQVATAGGVSAELAKLVGNAQGLYQPSEAVIGNRTVRIQLLPGGKNSPPTLRVALPIDVRTVGAKVEHGVYRDTARRRVMGKLAVLFRPEKPIDRFGKSLGLNVEHDTGDSAFDGEVYIESDADAADLEALLADTSTRQAVHQILGLGFGSVELFRGASTVQASVIRPTPQHVASAEQIVERLGVIADNLPAFDAAPVGRATPLRTAIAGAVGVLGGFGVFVFAVLAATTWRVIVPGAMVRCGLLGLGGWLVVSALAFVLVRGKSDALRTFSIVFFSALFGMPALGVGTGATLNGVLDAGAATSHDARVTRRWVTTSKNSRTYHLEVESWRPDESRIEVTVSSGQYDQTVDGSPLRITTKPGWLGWEWIARVQVLSRTWSP